MKKLIVVTLACLAVCGVWAQNAGTLGASDVKEYVSVVLTMGAKEVPQDSLARYGVLVQTRNGRMATALVPVDNYEAFLHSGLVQVQPSTRVFLRDSQVSSQPATKHCENHTAGVRPDEGRDEPHAAADMRSDDPRRGHDMHRGHPYDHHGAADRPARRNMIPADRIADEDARGCFFGLLLGGSRNWELVDNAAQAGYWYVDQGLNLDVRTGYQFNQNVGFITGLQLLSKNYSQMWISTISITKHDTATSTSSCRCWRISRWATRRCVYIWPWAAMQVCGAHSSATATYIAPPAIPA